MNSLKTVAANHTVRSAQLCLTILVAGCLSAPGPISSEPVKVEPWEGKLYTGDYQRAAIVRDKASEVILCSSEDFEKFLCMTHMDFRGMYSALVEAKMKLRECEAR